MNVIKFNEKSQSTAVTNWFEETDRRILRLQKRQAQLWITLCFVIGYVVVDWFIK